jgi:hypothetical protein
VFYQYNADASHASRALSARFGVVVTILLPGSISGRIQSFPAIKTHLIAFDVHDSYTGSCVPHALRVRQKKRERNVLNKASYSQMCLADSVQFGQQTTMSHCTFTVHSPLLLLYVITYCTPLSIHSPCHHLKTFTPINYHPVTMSKHSPYAEAQIGTFMSGLHVFIKRGGTYRNAERGQVDRF